MRRLLNAITLPLAVILWVGSILTLLICGAGLLLQPESAGLALACVVAVVVLPIADALGEWVW